MTGRFGYFLVAGAALFGGMVFQGDIDLGSELGDHESARTASEVDRRVDRRIDRVVDRATRTVEIRDKDGETIEADPATRRALAAAIAELVRAEGSLVAIKLDDQIPAEVIKQAEHRRDLARQAVDRLAEDAKVQSRSERDDLRDTIRDEVRDAVRG